MFTFFLLVLFVIAMVSIFKKDSHNRSREDATLDRLPSFTVHARPMSTFSKIMNLAASKGELLQTFSYSNRTVTIVTQDGKRLESPLASLKVRFEKYHGTVIYEIKSGSQKTSFYQTTNVTNSEWKAISNVLSLAGTTWGRDKARKKGLFSNYEDTTIKAINDING